MKAFTTVMKVLAALAAVVGAVYVVATYGDKIVAWAKKMLGCSCGEVCACEEGECTCEEGECCCEEACCCETECCCEEEVCEAAEEAVEEVPAEEAPAAEDAVVAEETDFEG